MQEEEWFSEVFDHQFVECFFSDFYFVIALFLHIFFGCVFVNNFINVCKFNLVIEFNFIEWVNNFILNKFPKFVFERYFLFIRRITRFKLKNMNADIEHNIKFWFLNEYMCSLIDSFGCLISTPNLEVDIPLIHEHKHYLN